MTDLQPLTMLLDQHERQRDAALVEHQRVRVASEAAAAQAAQLLAYRHDYEQRWQTQFRQAAQIEVLRHYQSFMERLTQAVEQQARIAEHAHAQVERALVALRDTEVRCASVRKLIERRTHEQRSRSDRLDQKRSDELASRAAWDHPNAPGRR